MLVQQSNADGAWSTMFLLKLMAATSKCLKEERVLMGNHPGRAIQSVAFVAAASCFTLRLLGFCR
jgi:hypothetical protein